MPKSMLDTEFDEFEDNVFGDDPPVHEEPKELPLETLKPEEVEVVIEDDTPEQDRGRPTADNLPTDDEDEATKYSRRVKERIAKETAKVHAERRSREALDRELNAATAYMKNLIRENTQLKDMVENGEKVLVTEHTSRLKGDMESAKAAYREAHEAGDVNGMLAAQQNMAMAAAKLSQAEVHQVRPLTRTDEAEADKFYKQAQGSPQVDPRAAEWAARNTWFQRDDVMTYVAMSAHKKLVSEGVTPDHADYYKSIDAEVRKRFPEKFKTAERTAAPRRTESVVAGVSRGNGAPARTKVTLTESQVKLAKRLGLKPEEYASQFAAERGGTGEWVHGRKS